MTAFERTDYMASLEAGTLMLKASDADAFVQYESEDGRTMKYLPFLPPNCTLYPIEKVLHDHYTLSRFSTLISDFDLLSHRDSSATFMKLWTFAYYAGMADFSSEDIYVVSDGVNFWLPPLFNYEGAFSSPCDFEIIRPPVRAFQVNWFYFAHHRGELHEQPPYISQAIQHFTQQKYYR